LDDSNCRKTLLEELHTAIGASVINDQYLVASGCLEDAGKKLLEQMAAVPAQDLNRDWRSLRWPDWRNTSSESQQRRKDEGDDLSTQERYSYNHIHREETGDEKKNT
jgi:hypothetical protein